MEQSISSLNLPRNKIIQLQSVGKKYCIDLTETLLSSLLIELPKSPKTVTALDLLESEFLGGHILSLNSELDKVLHGEITPGRITELSGFPGSGRTQICFQLCVTTQLPEAIGGLEGQVIYLNTNKNFSSTRLKEVAGKLIKLSGPLMQHKTEEDILSNVFVFNVNDVCELFATTIFLGEFLKTKSVKLVIIDSIAHPLRAANSTERITVTYKLLDGFQKLSRAFNFAVVITNDFTTRVKNNEAYYTPSFGDGFFERINSRICLSKQGNVHTAELVKSVVKMLKKQKYTKCILDEVYVLQHFEDMFESGNFEEKWLIEKCQKPPKMKFFYYANITASNVKCLSFHGPATKLAELFKLEKSRTLMLERAEVALHDTFGNDLYWKARRSMRFNRELRKVANDFRIMKLDSNDEDDLTTLPPDWRDEKPKRNAKGGPYLAVHMRRRDFLRGRADKVPDLLNVAKQISKKLNELKLAKVFIATDAPRIEFEELNKALSPKYEVYKYQASKHVESKYSAGGIAIIDQIICSYARYFIGTSDSTFSFRIQEEREILGFPTKSTFNVLCKNNTNCEKPSVWKIVY
ncbi:uncharacterized protein LOC109532735 isoform X1 [Dendroctonus ponderosae]|uniref:uncharacterized protein LOC109532735 isoform X1 n=1 Tax=Dendroctonus ponderosae TaxID=77166 RepID=UPI002034EF15|nr:uncharacterized protein LOC109532735 isoform X1 [Dendroctonus ponderosae]